MYPSPKPCVTHVGFLSTADLAQDVLHFSLSPSWLRIILLFFFFLVDWIFPASREEFFPREELAPFAQAQAICRGVTL